MNSDRRVRGRWVRPALLALAVPQAATGALALFAPRVFYDGFPTPGRHWIATLGPYNEHLVTDVGAGLFALAGLLAMAALLLDRLLLMGALTAWLLFYVPHLAFHVRTTAFFGAGDNVGIIASLGLPLLVAAAVLVHVVRRPGATRPREGA